MAVRLLPFSGVASAWRLFYDPPHAESNSIPEYVLTYFPSAAWCWQSGKL